MITSQKKSWMMTSKHRYRYRKKCRISVNIALVSDRFEKTGIGLSLVSERAGDFASSHLRAASCELRAASCEEKKKLKKKKKKKKKNNNNNNNNNNRKKNRTSLQLA